MSSLSSRTHSILSRKSTASFSLGTIHEQEETAPPPDEWIGRGDFTIDVLQGGDNNSTWAGSTQRSSQSVFGYCFRRCCLHPKLRFRTQLLLSFGVVSLLSIFVVVLTAVIAALRAGDYVKNVSVANLEQWSQEKLATSSRIVASTISQKFRIYNGISAFLSEVTRDRFVGYPDHPGYADDLLVPFEDSLSGNNVYPLKGSPLPLDWSIEPTLISNNNVFEHLHNRHDWYKGRILTTETAVMRIQGACDPNETSPSGIKYYPDCTVANNEWTTGGSVQPTPTFRLLHEKASDYASVTLKALYEAHKQVHSLGYSYANAGAGATVSYPGMVTLAALSYISIGCTWMRSPNPLDTSRSIGTEEEIARCHPAGTSVPKRDFNPLETAWCRDQALNPSQPMTYGPHRSYHGDNRWFLTHGQAAYDRVTKNFIGCTHVDTTIVELGRAMKKYRMSNSSELVFFRWDDGIVVVSDRWDSQVSTTIPTISELPGMGVSEDLFAEMQQRFGAAYTEDYNVTDHDPYDPVFYAAGKVFALHPVPYPPKLYDASYKPEFAIIVALDKGDLLEFVNLDTVDNKVWNLICNILVVGVMGLAIVTLCLSLVSMYLTRPMNWMNKVGDEIVQSVGSAVKEIQVGGSPSQRCSPRTEISSLVRQFRTTVQRFSGQGIAKVHSHKGIEVKNPFSAHASFGFLYKQRDEGSFRYNYEHSKKDQGHRNIQFDHDLHRLHWGPNLRWNENAFSNLGSAVVGREREKKKNVFRSRLFWWILATIALPLLITMIAISTYVTMSISIELPNLISVVNEVFLDFEKSSLSTLTKSRADFATKVIEPRLIDVIVMARIGGWLYHDALKQKESFTEMTSGAEECKDYPSNGCPWANNRTNTPCDCKWRTSSTGSGTCTDSGTNDTRHLQKLWYMAPSLDADENGVINSTSFPATAYSRNTTAWWGNIQELPGYPVENVSNTPAIDTTYDALHLASAMSVVQFPLFNYNSPRIGIPAIGTYLNFDDYGIMAGWTGCVASAIYASSFKSRETTSHNTDLCPYGKYGFDVRCRPWYVDAKQRHSQKDVDPMYVTPPYRYRQGGEVVLSAALPLNDVLSDGYYVGNAMADFDIDPIVEALTMEETPLSPGGMHILIPVTTTKGFRSDVVVGPNFGFDALEDLNYTYSLIQNVLPYDCVNGTGVGCDNHARFEDILKSMRVGDTGTTSFSRTTDDGSSEEVYWSYAPVKSWSPEPINRSNFAAGLKNHESLIFSLGLVETVPGIRSARQSVQKDLDGVVISAVIVLGVVTGLALICVCVVSTRVTGSVIVPVEQLLSLVKSINRNQVTGDMAEIPGGSMEIDKVRDTFERLYMVIRFASNAFYSGELARAHEALQEALILFTKLNNAKAIGVANNNLGNTMLTVYSTMVKTQAPVLCGLTKQQVIENGVIYFKAAIDQGEAALAEINDREGWSTNYLIFMQQLSNRYFNRAIFLLTVMKDHPESSDAERQGFTDLSTSKDMDREVVDNGDNIGFKGDSCLYFELLLGRIRGVLQLVELGFKDEWEIEELFADARQLLVASLKKGDEDLFRDVEAAAQMQRLDSVLIQYYQSIDEKEKAATIAIRMLLEDDYVLREPALHAIKALIDFMPEVDAADLGGEDRSDVVSRLFQYRHKVNEVLAVTSLGSQAKEGKKNLILRESAKQSGNGAVSMEMF